MTEVTRKQTFLTLTSLLAIGSFLRFYKLDFQGLWYDELHSIIPTDPSNTIASIVEYCKIDQPPAFFLYIHYVFKVFGYSEIVGRAASATIGVLCIPAVYFLGKEVKNNTVGLAAAFIVTFNYFSIFYSQELRFYSFAFLFTSLSFAFFIRSLKSNKLLDYFAYWITTTILLYTHYYGMVIFASQGIIFLIVCVVTKTSSTVIVKSALAGLAVALAFSPWLPVVFGDLQIGEFWIQKPKAIFLAEYFYLYQGKDFVLTIIFIVFLVLFFKGIKFNRENPDLIAIITVVLWLILSYTIPLIRSLTSTPILHVRYTIVSLPAWIILFAWGWSRVKNMKAGYGLAGIIALSSLLNIFFVRDHYTKITKQQFREAANVVIAKNHEELPVVTILPWHYSFYFRNTPHTINDNTSISVETKRFWMLPVQIFSPAEIEAEVAKFSDFEIAERHVFNKTQAILMVKKPL